MSIWFCDYCGPCACSQKPKKPLSCGRLKQKWGQYLVQTSTIWTGDKKRKNPYPLMNQPPRSWNTFLLGKKKPGKKCPAVIDLVIEEMSGLFSYVELWSLGWLHWVWWTCTCNITVRARYAFRTLQSSGVFDNDITILQW